MMMPFACIDCARLQETPEPGGEIGTFWCAAFPKGIPADVFYGRVDHREPVEGDNGIRFKPKHPFGAAESYARFIERVKERGGSYF